MGGIPLLGSLAGVTRAETTNFLRSQANRQGWGEVVAMSPEVDRRRLNSVANIPLSLEAGVS